MCARKKRGLTLLEILAASSLSLLALSVLTAVMIPAFRSTAQNGARIEMQQQSRVVLRRIARDAQSSLPAGMALLKHADGQVLSIHRITGVVAGDPPVQAFSHQLVFYRYRRAPGVLERIAWPADPAHPITFDALLQPPDGTSAVRPTTASLTSILNGSLTGQRLASEVTSFDISSPAAEPDLLSPLDVQLDLRRMLTGRSVATVFHDSQKLSLRNTE